jgi:hypothetical protein
LYFVVALGLIARGAENLQELDAAQDVSSRTVAGVPITRGVCWMGWVGEGSPPLLPRETELAPSRPAEPIPPLRQAQGRNDTLMIDLPLSSGKSHVLCISFPDDRFSFDLYQHFRRDEPGDFHHRGDRADVAEKLTVSFADFLPVSGNVGNVHPRADYVF